MVHSTRSPTASEPRSFASLAACDHSGDPCDDDGLFCNGNESCNETDDVCDHAGNPCGDDGAFCNGAESCNETSDVCDHSGDPCGNDGAF